MSQFVTEGCQGRSSSRKLEAGTEVDTLEEHCLLAHPPDMTAFYFNALQDHLPWVSTTYNEWVLLQSLIKKMTQASLMEATPQLRFPFQGD